MFLQQIEVENFRKIEKLVLPLNDTTVIIGENNMGKTSILEALRFCLGRSLVRRSNAFDSYDCHHLPEPP